MPATPIRELIRLDDGVLRALSGHGCAATYVIRNCLDWPGQYHYGRGLKTGAVLRSCRRLAKRGLIEEAPHTSYAVMKVWQTTPDGRAVLASEAAASAAA